MKYKLLLLFIATLFAFSSCNKDKITLAIVSPENNAVFSKGELIDVVVTATTQKGSIIQVQLFVDGWEHHSLTDKPYHFTVPTDTLSVGLHFLTAIAHSSEGVMEGESVDIYIE